MKKKLFLLSLITVLIATFFVVGCSLACKHEFGDGKISKPATFTEEGELVYTCALCGSKKVEVLPIKDCVVTFDLDGGVAQNLNTVLIKYGNKIDAPTETPIKEGYEFIGWFIDEQEFDFSNVVIYDNLEIKAKWKARTYNITYLLHDGVINTNPTTYTPDDEIELQDPTRENYVFMGWNKNGETEKFSVIEKGTVGDMTLTAVWEIKKYIVTYELNGGEEVIANQTEFTYKSARFVLNDASKLGYKFDGWYYQNQRIYAIEELREDITINAKYIPLVYKINYLLDDGVTHSNPTEYTVEDEIILTEPKREGYVFMGWNKNGSTNVITKIKKGTIGVLTLTANWKIVTHNVTYVLDGGVLAISNPTVWTQNSTSIVLNNPSKLGYKFNGWYLDGEKIDKLENITTDITIEARYDIITYTITYILEDGVTHSNPKTYTVEDEIVLKDAILNGYQFVCWNKDGGSEEYFIIEKGTTGDIILTATFIK